MFCKSYDLYLCALFQKYVILSKNLWVILKGSLWGQVNKGILVLDADGHYIFAKNHEFSSPSAAGSVVRGS